MFPYFLTTGRVPEQYNSGVQTRRVAELCEARPEPFVEINPETAKTLGVGDGDIVNLTTRRGRAALRARLTRDIRFDTLFAPFHWGAAAAVNTLTNAALDPVSRIPEFKVCAVRIEKIVAPITWAQPIKTINWYQKRHRHARVSPKISKWRLFLHRRRI